MSACTVRIGTLNSGGEGGGGYGSGWPLLYILEILLACWAEEAFVWGALMCFA